jgi:hypothetical protein
MVNKETPFPAIVHMALGRPPMPAVWLPDVAQHVVDAVANWIGQSYHSSRTENAKKSPHPRGQGLYRR